MDRPSAAYGVAALVLVALLTASTSRGQEMIFPGEEWETASPESQAINALRLDSAIEFLHPDFNSSARDLVVVRNGLLVWASPTSYLREGVASVTKSFASTVLGLLIDDGEASLETRAADIVPSLAEDYPDVTFRHLATMTSGYQNVGASGTPAYWDPAEPFFPLGTQYYYSGPGMDQLSNAMTQIAGEPIADLFQRRVADPIGMSGWSWSDSSPNNPPGSVAAVNFGRFGLEISAQDAARFGHLFLNRGQWDGQQLVSADWVDEATRVQVDKDVPVHPGSFPLGPGVYGYNWWVNGIKPDDDRPFPDAPANLFFASGAGDNEIFVLPTWKIVIAKTAAGDTTDLLAWNGFFRQLDSALLPDGDGTHLDVAPEAVYAVFDDTFDDLGDRAIDVSTASDAEIGETDLASANNLSRFIAKFALPVPPAGRPILQQATLGVRLVSTEGSSLDPISVWHSRSDNDTEQAAADYEDPSYVDALGDIVPPIEDAYDLAQYYDLDVTDSVLADYASDGPNPLSAFRLQVDGASFVEDDQSHRYALSMPGATYRPQLLLTFSGIPGDFDYDGDVDGDDFCLWQQGASPDPVSVSDLADWKDNYGAPASAKDVRVPEPGALILAVLCLAPMVIWRHGRAVVCVVISVATVHGSPVAQADVYQWEYVDPLDPSLGKQPSTTLCPDGAGLTPAPGMNALGKDLRMGYLSGFDLADANFESATLTDAYLRDSDLTSAYLSDTFLTDADLGRTNLDRAIFRNAALYGTDFSDAEIRGTDFSSTTDSGFTAEQMYATASYQTGNLAGIGLAENDLTGWNFADQDLESAYLPGADLSTANLTDANFFAATLTGANLSGAQVRGANFFIVPGGPVGPNLGTGLTTAQLYSTASYQSGDLTGIGLGYNDLIGCNFAGIDLTNADLGSARITGADLSNAEVRGANFSYTGITSLQLYSTASYKAGDLTGMVLHGKDLSGWNFAGKDLTDARFGWATLSNTDFSDAEVRGASFYRTSDFTSVQLYSTASYQSGALAGINLAFNDLTSWDFSGRDLIDAVFEHATLNGADLSGANLTDAYFREAALSGVYLGGADARAADHLDVSSAATHNLIHPDGHIEGLIITAGETMRLWDYDPTYIPLQYSEPIGEIQILVAAGMSIDPDGTLRVVFEDDQWGSMITFESGIPASLAGTLELLFDDDADPMSLVGTTYQIFDWTGVMPTGAFDLILFHPGTTWDTSSLYATGEVTLVSAIPEPSALLLWGICCGAGVCAARRLVGVSMAREV